LSGELVKGGCVYLATMLADCCPHAESVRLYRSGVDLPFMRIRVATFDADFRDAAAPDHNWKNCEIFRDLAQSRPGVIVRYWCEGSE
jgi:hypothetical protein